METLFNINSTWMTRIVCHQHAIDNSASSLLFEVVQFKKLVSTPWEVPSPCRLDNRMFSNSNEKYMQLASLNGVTEKQMAHSQTRVTANKK